VALDTSIWTFTTTRANGEVVSIDVRPPEFGDVTRIERAQAKGETDAQVRFVQDLGHEAMVLEFEWANLTRCERDDLQRFFGVQGTLYQVRPFSIEVSDGSSAAFGISTGLGLSTGEAWTSGQLVEAAGPRWGTVYLDTPALSFITDRVTQRYTLALRFRVEVEGVAPAST
jgi:hypothetical protein